MKLQNNWLLDRPFAHRGWHNSEIPENSLTAFEEAIKRNYGIQLDVVLTEDRKVIVFNDPRLSRMTGVDGYVANSTYAGIKNLKLGKTNEHIPLLSDVLKLVDGRVPVIINIKSVQKLSFESLVLDEIKNYKGDVAIISLNPKTLEWFKLNAPHIRRGQIGGVFTSSLIPRSMRVQAKKLNTEKQTEPNFIVYLVKDMPSWALRKYASLPILGFVVKSVEDVEKCKRLGYNMIIEDIEL